MENGNGFAASFGFELLTYKALIDHSNSKQPVWSRQSHPFRNVMDLLFFGSTYKLLLERLEGQSSNKVYRASNEYRSSSARNSKSPPL